MEIGTCLTGVREDRHRHRREATVGDLFPQTQIPGAQQTGDTSDQKQGGGFTGRARQREHGAGQNAGSRRGQHVRPYGLPLCGPHTHGTFADGARDRAQGLRRRDDDDRQHQDRQGEATGDDGASPGDATGELHEDGETEDPVHDRRHSRQVAHVDANQARQPRTTGVFLEIHRTGDSERERHHDHDDRQGQGSANGLPHTRLLGVRRVET